MMARRKALVVQVQAVHLACARCGETVRIAAENLAGDVFTEEVLMPAGSWWVAHFEPRVLRFEILADGEPQEWVPV